jgi:hypothetical protein
MFKRHRAEKAAKAYQGDLVRQLQAELARLDAERPAAPAGAQG